MAKKKSHAIHNEAACHYLNDTKKFPDWVIISAFYSAIHFVDDFMFPNQYELPNGEMKNFSTIDDYYNRCRQKGSLKTKHDMRWHLVQDSAPEIAAAFKWLMDQSFTMRYSNYEVDQDEANHAINYLQEIKTFCC